MAVHILDEGIVDDRPEAFGEGEHLVRRQLLVLQEDDEMLKEGVVDFRETLLVQRPRQVGAANDRAQRTGDRFDRDGFVGHGLGSASADRSVPL